MKRGLATSLLALVACGPLSCEAEPVVPGIAEASTPIIGGEPDDADPAVVLLAAWSPDLATLDLCTATLVAPDVLLTAAHCIDDESHPGWSYGVFLEPDANAYPSASTLVPKLVDIAERHVHPDYDPSPPFTADIGVLILAAPRPTKPLPFLRTPFSADLVGTEARIVGYGQTLYEEPNAKKHAATTVVAAIDDGDTITVGDVDHKTCIGDSGGPALVVVDGVETVVGVNSYTDLAGCLEPAHYRRTDLYAAFLDTFVPPPPAEEGGGGAGAGSSATAGTGGAAGAPLPPEDGTDADEAGGCSVGAPARNGAGPLVGAVLLALLARSRRRPTRTPA